MLDSILVEGLRALVSWSESTMLYGMPNMYLLFAAFIGLYFVLRFYPLWIEQRIIASGRDVGQRFDTVTTYVSLTLFALVGAPLFIAILVVMGVRLTGATFP